MSLAVFNVKILDLPDKIFARETLLCVAIESGFGSTFLPSTMPLSFQMIFLKGTLAPTITSQFSSTPNITLTTPVNSGLYIGQEILVKEALDSEQFGKLIAETSKIILKGGHIKTKSEAQKRASLKRTTKGGGKSPPQEGAYRSISPTNNSVL
ncbi:hypothetical protein VNO78_14860 [Psophocarpus tetragonolobus]|uniref:Uncharacterized protein n=1 Tax=Psophocarpus tetragonolobus TaxID=3891 RepID=A0AAN9SIM0_PSOTE